MAVHTKVVDVRGMVSFWQMTSTLVLAGIMQVKDVWATVRKYYAIDLLAYTHANVKGWDENCLSIC